MGQHSYCLAALVAVFAAFIYLAEKEGWLERWKRQTVDGFVGAFARTPGLQGCMAFNDSDGRSMWFNRCTYV